MQTSADHERNFFIFPLPYCSNGGGQGQGEEQRAVLECVEDLTHIRAWFHAYGILDLRPVGMPLVTVSRSPDVDDVVVVEDSNLSNPSNLRNLRPCLI